MRARVAIPLTAILALAALNFLWQLGSSSYFVDEVFSIRHALPPVHSLLGAVSRSENTPWTYFLFLHEWLYRTSSQAEWVTRLPSALAAIALVGAVYWMAAAFVERVAALGAAALLALSPLALQYAQQVRVYAFAMLAVTVAVGATVRAVGESAARRRLLLLGAFAAAAALWLHYMATVVIMPLCVWVALREDVPRRARAGFVGACLVADLVVLPLFIYQRGHNPPGVFPGSTLLKLIGVAETPFDGRYTAGINSVRLLAVAVVLASLVSLLVVQNRGAVRERRLLVALGLLPPLTVCLISALGSDILISRYSSLAAPFLLTAIAAAATTLPRPAATGLIAAALLVSTYGLILSHRRGGLYLPAREAIAYIKEHREPGDVVVSPADATAEVPLGYYAARGPHPIPAYLVYHGPQDLAAIRRARRRIWVIVETPPHLRLLRAAAAALGPFGYRPVGVHLTTTYHSFAVYLAVPS